jgi:hypothetical protein
MFDMTAYSRNRHRNSKFLIWLHHRIRMLQIDDPVKVAPLAEVLVQIDPDDCRGWLARECQNQELARELLDGGPC